MKSFFLICVAFALCVCSGAWQLRSETTADLSAIVKFSSGERVTMTDFSELVGVAPSDIVHLTVNIPGTGPGEHASVRSPAGIFCPVPSTLTNRL